jgi:ABC-type sugar transport system permease subunit
MNLPQPRARRARATPPVRAAGSASRPYRRWTPYLFILPFFLIFLPFGAGSVLLGAGMSFTSWPVGQAPHFNGLHNYAALVHDDVFATSLYNTLKMLAGYLALLMPACLLIAVALQRLRDRSRNAVQVLLFVPVTMSLIAVAVVFDLLYNDNVGLVNGMLGWAGLGPVHFLTDPGIAPWSIVVLRVWRVLGYYAIILFAGLQGIPRDLYEAAAIDGAGPWQQFRHLTLPLLRPVTKFVLVAASIAGWELFAEPQVLTDGGPARATLTVVMYLYQASFEEFDLGRGAAAGVVLAALIIATTLLVNRALRSRTDA